MTDRDDPAELELERLASLVRNGEVPPGESAAILRVSWIRLAWRLLRFLILAPFILGFITGKVLDSVYGFWAGLILGFLLISVVVTREVLADLRKRGNFFLLVTPLGFYRAEGGAGGQIVLWSNVDKLIRSATPTTDHLFIKLKNQPLEKGGIAFDAKDIPFKGGISKVIRLFCRFGNVK